jgi:antitoxin component YwqK of YwqJK toxin-antitoxin module
MRFVILVVLLLPLLILLKIGLTEQAVNIDEIVISPKGLHTYKGLPYTGKTISYYSNGQMSELATFRNGHRHGYLKRWFPNRVLGFYSLYEDGRLHGETKSWWDNGKLYSVSNYQQGKTDSYVKQWYAAGYAPGRDSEL